MARRRPAPKKLSNEARLQKNERIKATMKATKERRAKMDCKTYELKLDYSSTNHKQRETLTRLFLEAKWLRNSCIANSRFDRAYFKELDGSVPVKNGDSFENREFLVLGGQLAQSVIDEITYNLRALSALKRKGKKLGRLKFKKQVTSINFPQYGNSHKIDEKHRRVKIANIPGWIKVRGLGQLPDKAEFSNMKLVHRPSGYYCLFTVFIPKNKKTGFQPDTAIGLDMGVQTHMTLSNGIKIGALLEETDRARKLRRKLSRQTKGSNRYAKTWRQLNTELERITNRKNDAANKVVHELLKNETVYFQDENLKSWGRKDSESRGSRRIHSSILGRVKARLSASPRTVMVDRFAPTTATCPVCGNKTPHGLGKRTFNCPVCEYGDDRDVHAANNMVRFGLGVLPLKESPSVGRTGTLVEIGVRPCEAMDFSFMAEHGGLSVKREAVRSLA